MVSVMNKYIELLASKKLFIFNFIKIRLYKTLVSVLPISFAEKKPFFEVGNWFFLFAK